MNKDELILEYETDLEVLKARVNNLGEQLRYWQAENLRLQEALAAYHEPQPATAKRPMPKELVVSVFAARLLSIIASSEDAREWITREAPSFGNFFKGTLIPDDFWLDVSNAYDLDEVVAYLKSYNEQ